MRKLLWILALVPVLAVAQPTQEEARRMAYAEAQRLGMGGIVNVGKGSAASGGWDRTIGLDANSRGADCLKMVKLFEAKLPAMPGRRISATRGTC